MYTSRINIDAIRTIDTIMETPPIHNTSALREKPSAREEHSFDSKEQSREALYQIVEEASEALEAVNTALTFQIHEGTGRPVIQLVELQTKKVIREIPSEKMLDVVAGIWEWAGLIVDRKE